jgi:hypothetical protein
LPEVLSVRAPLVFAVAFIASVTQLRSRAEAQVRVAQPRTAIAGSPTVFIGGYYYPSLYHASLWYAPWGPAYFGYPYYQFPVYGPGRYDMSGSVRVRVSPREAEVFVDGYFAGNVDDFDGVFQRLNIEPGEHEVEIHLDGYRALRQRFYLQPGKSFNIKHTMERLAPGEPASPRPTGTPLTGPGRSPDRSRVGPIPPASPWPDDPPRGAAADRGRVTAPGGAASFGSLSLRAQPADAEVLIDGEAWNGTRDDDRLVIQLGAGTHHLEIRKDGYRSYLTDISIVVGQAKTLNVALTKQ